MNRIQKILSQLDDCTALTLLGIIAVELAYIAHKLSSL